MNTWSTTAHFSMSRNRSILSHGFKLLWEPFFTSLAATCYASNPSLSTQSCREKRYQTSPRGLPSWPCPLVVAYHVQTLSWLSSAWWSRSGDRAWCVHRTASEPRLEYRKEPVKRVIDKFDRFVVKETLFFSWI